jgi:glucose 1-dehydrogenase
MMTNGRLAGHSVLVTGASSGIGLGIARKMAEEGAAVGINYRSHQEPAEKLAAEIRAWGGKAVAIGADVSKELDVHRLFEETVSAFGRMDGLVANSGLQKDAAVADMTLDDWRTVIDINLTGQFLCCREAVRLFRKQAKADRPARSAGNIVCMSSVHELIPWAGHLNYAASKGGIRMMADPCPGGRLGHHPRQCSGPRCYSNPDQSGGLGNQGGNGEAAEADPLWAHRRAGGRGTRDGLARLG